MYIYTYIYIYILTKLYQLKERKLVILIGDLFLYKKLSSDNDNPIERQQISIQGNNLLQHILHLAF